MKVIAISYLFPNKIMPNSGIFVFNRIKSVSKYCEVEVINPVPWFPLSRLFKKYKNYSEVPKVESIDGIKVYHPRFFMIPKYLKFIDALTYFVAVTKVFHRIGANTRADLIDLHWTYPDLPTGHLLSRLYDKRVIVTVRGLEAYYESTFGLVPKIIKYCLNKMDHVVALSRELADVAVQYKVDSSKITVVRNGVDNNNFTIIDGAMAYVKTKLPQNKKIILSVGSLIYRKGFDRIIKCLPDIINKYPDVLLVIVGGSGAEGDYQDEIRGLIRSLELDNYVILAGAVNNSELVYWYNAADIFCLASRGEGNPNVLLEALACGCPSVSTNVGSVSEVMTEDLMGELVDNSDNAILGGLMKVLESSYDRRLISQIVSKYDWDWCAGQVLEVYKKIERNKKDGV